MRATLNLIITALIIINIVSCHGIQKQVSTDAQMIEHFELNETLFEELRSMIENDALSHFPLFAREKRDSIALCISADRELEYDSLMNKIQIKRFRYFSPLRKAEKNSILFYFFIKGDATWSIEKGFEYVFDRSKEDDKEFTEKELYDLVFKKRVNQCEYYKKINDNWNLFIFYDR